MIQEDPPPPKSSPPCNGSEGISSRANCLIACSMDSRTVPVTPFFLRKAGNEGPAWLPVEGVHVGFSQPITFPTSRTHQLSLAFLKLCGIAPHCVLNNARVIGPNERQ